mmetsp:Transcript_22105/g.50820  ORF Transcript_22105/g.50820 Transcript_22105/m.50820 type:complete len:295 (+) Transcript_22105:446-1330(+)
MVPCAASAVFSSKNEDKKYRKCTREPGPCVVKLPPPDDLYASTPSFGISTCNSLMVACNCAIRTSSSPVLASAAMTACRYPSSAAEAVTRSSSSKICSCCKASARVLSAACAARAALDSSAILSRSISAKRNASRVLARRSVATARDSSFDAMSLIARSSLDCMFETKRRACCSRVAPDSNACSISRSRASSDVRDISASSRSIANWACNSSLVACTISCKDLSRTSRLVTAASDTSILTRSAAVSRRAVSTSCSAVSARRVRPRASSRRCASSAVKRSNWLLTSDSTPSRSAI